MSALSRTLELLDLVGLPCKVTQRDGSLVVDRDGGMQAVARAIGDESIEVLYEQAPHETARVQCSPEAAAVLIRRVMSRTRLEPVPPPEG